MSDARVELANLIDNHDDACDRPSCDWSMHLADVVLSWVEKRYVPTSDVLNLAQHWEDSGRKWLAEQPRTSAQKLDCAAELRALTQTKTEKEN